MNGYNAHSTLFWCSAALVIIGVLDDRFNLGVFVRVLSEIAVAVVLIEALDLQVRYLGDLLSVGVIKLSDGLAYPFTAIAIFGVINAFNMLDGMDGLVASIVVTTLLIFHVLTAAPASPMSLTVLSSLAAFLVSNLKSLKESMCKSYAEEVSSEFLEIYKNNEPAILACGPHGIVPIITYFPFAVVAGITALVGLDYLGFGLSPPTPSWGQMLDVGLQNIRKWWMVFAPVTAQFLTLLCIVFIGEGVREAFDPKVYSRLR